MLVIIISMFVRRRNPLKFRLSDSEKALRARTTGIENPNESDEEFLKFLYLTEVAAFEALHTEMTAGSFRLADIDPNVLSILTRILKIKAYILEADTRSAQVWSELDEIESEVFQYSIGNKAENGVLDRITAAIDAAEASAVKLEKSPDRFRQYMLENKFQDYWAGHQTHFNTAQSSGKSHPNYVRAIHILNIIEAEMNKLANLHNFDLRTKSSIYRLIWLALSRYFARHVDQMK
jgi:hypothetical protein